MPTVFVSNSFLIKKDWIEEIFNCAGDKNLPDKFIDSRNSR